MRCTAWRICREMASDIEKARELLRDGGYTCVLVSGGESLVSRERGVKPLVGFLDGGIEAGFCAADRVVGRAAAFLYVLLGASQVWAGVMSRGAAEVFARYGIACSCDTLTDSIVNRRGDGPCPMEEAVRGVGEPEAALEKIRLKLSELAGK